MLLLKSDRGWILLIGILLCFMTSSITARNLINWFNVGYAQVPRIIWNHDVNTTQKYQRALRDNSMILDFYVELMSSWNQPEYPVMVGLAARSSRSAFTDVVNQVTQTGRKGIQLSFTDINTLRPTLEELGKINTSTRNPIIFHADVCKGPNSNRKQSFDLESSARNFSKILKESNYSRPIIMYGFIEHYNRALRQENTYGWDMLFRCLEGVYSLDTRPLNFRFRAAWLKKSWPRVLWLLNLSNRITVTIYAEIADEIDFQSLVNLQGSSNNRIYYDFPASMINTFNNQFRRLSPQPTQNVTWSEKDLWQAFKHGNEWQSIVRPDWGFVTDEGVAIIGESKYRTYVQTKQQYRPQMNNASGNAVVISGRIVQLRTADFKGAPNDPEPEIEIRGQKIMLTKDGYLPISKHFPSPRRRGITLTLKYGIIELKDHVNFAQVSAVLPLADCFEFALYDGGPASPITAILSVVTCEDAPRMDPNEGRNVTLSLPQSSPYAVDGQSFYITLSKESPYGNVLFQNLSIGYGEIPSSGGKASVSIALMILALFYSY